MALATEDDVAAALGRQLTDAERGAASALLETATDLVTGYLHPCPIPTPTPAAISRVIADMVAAVFSRPAGVLANTSDLSADIYGVKFAEGSTSPTPYLTAALRERLAPYACTGFVSMPLVSERRRRW